MMGRIVIWIVIVFAVLFWLRLLGAAKTKRRADSARRRDAAAAQPMVRCARCGVFLPRADAKPAPGGFGCGDPGCAQRRRSQP
jgi:uncharacterized protein